MSFVYKKGDKWGIKQQLYFGTYDTLEEALEKRDQLLKEGELVSKMKKKDTRHINMTNTGKYVIRKMINGKIEHFGTFNTLEDAIDERDYLESIDWDYENMW